MGRQEEVDVLIIGAGPAGAVAAAYLAAQGVSLRVVEKSTFPRFVIGESLLPRSMEHFDEVGLLEAIKEKGFEIKRGARFIKDGITCLFDFSDKHSEGWDWTWQVPRADFDHCLTEALASKGVTVEFGQCVKDVTMESDGSSRTIITDEAGKEESIRAKHIIDCSGYGRVLAQQLGLDQPSELPDHSSIFGHVQDIRRPEGEEGTLITFDVFDTDTWMWVIPFSDGVCSVGFVGKTEFIHGSEEDAASRWERLVGMSDNFKDRFEGLPLMIGPIEIQNFSKSVSKLYGKGFVLAGNSAEFLDPVFSSGVAFATESSLLAAKFIHRELKGEAVDWEKDYSDYIKAGVKVFSSYVREWYTGNLQTLFFHRPENLEVKRKICAVLAGYVWDKSNPFVTRHDRVISSMAYLLDREKKAKVESAE